MAKFVTIGERLSTTAPAVNKAFTERDPEPILKRAKQQLDAGATYLDVNIGPAENDGPELMKWAVELLQSNFDNVPLALDTSNVAAIEAGISVYNRSKGKPIVNSADAAGRIGYVDVAAANDAIVIALCNGEGIAKDNDERMMYMQTLMERGMEHILAYISIGDRIQDIERLVGALDDVERLYKKDSAGLLSGEYISPKVVMSPQKAFYSEKVSVPVEASSGRVCAEFVMCYPPGIPILAPGEMITDDVVQYILYAKKKGCSMQGTEDPAVDHLMVLANI